MINHAAPVKAGSGPKSADSGLDATPQPAPWCRHERFPRHLWHLPRDYPLAIRWLRPSFLTRDHWTPGRKGWVCHGTATLRYVDEGEAAVCAAGSEERPNVCLRTDGLGLRPYRQRPRGDRVRRAVPCVAPRLWYRSRHLGPQHHRRRRQDQRSRRARLSRRAAERGDPQGHRTDLSAISS